MEDFDLLRDFQRGSEDAFSLIVERHVNPVYSIALRTLHSPELAEEVAFSVFADLARNAPKVKTKAPLIAWLFRVTRRTAIDVLRRERRRGLRERHAVQFQEQNGDQVLPDEILSSLDSALEALRAPDRHIILSRYFREQDVSQIAKSLDISVEATQKRLERALERLREHFRRRGFAVSVASLGTVLAANAVQSAPFGIASSIAITVTGGMGAAATAQIGNFALMSITQKAVIIIATGIIATGLYQQAKLSQSSRKLTASVEAFERTRSQLSEMEAKLATANQENAKLREQNREIHGLRARLAELSREQSPGDHQASAPIRESTRQAADYLDEIEQLKNAFAAAPEQSIAEMRLVTDREWLEASIVMRESTQDGLEKAMAHLRTLAKGKFALHVNRALQNFVSANSGELPNSLDDIGPYLGEGVDPSALVRYELVRTGTTNEIQGGETIIRERDQPSVFDSQFNISLLGAGYATPKLGESERSYGFSYSSDDLPIN